MKQDTKTAMHATFTAGVSLIQGLVSVPFLGNFSANVRDDTDNTKSSLLSLLAVRQSVAESEWLRVPLIFWLSKYSTLRWRYTVTRLMIFIAVANVLAITTNYSPKIRFCINICRSILLDLHSIVVFGGRLEEFCKILTSVAVLSMQTRDH